MKENQTVLVVFNQKEMMFCDEVTFDILKYDQDEDNVNLECRFDINNIMSWGVSNYYFTVIIDVNSVYNKLYFETKQGRAIDFVISAYSNQLVGSQIMDEAIIL